MDYFADNGRVFIGDEVINTDARKSFITFGHEFIGANVLSLGITNVAAIDSI